MTNVYNKLMYAGTMLEAIRPTNMVMFFVGFPFYVVQKKKTKKYQIRTAKILVMYSALAYFIYLWNIYHILTMEGTTVDLINGSSLFKYGHRFKIYLDCLTIIVIYLESFWNRVEVPKSFGHLLDIDNTWKVLGLTKNYSYIKKGNFVALLVQGFVHVSQATISTVFMYSWMNMNSFSIIYAMTAPGYLFTALLTTYISGVNQARHNLVALNSELELICKHAFLTKSVAQSVCLKVDETSARQKQLFDELCSSSRDDIIIQRLTVYWMLYDKICDYVDSFNRIYLFKVFVIFSVSFASMVVNFFIALSALDWIANNKGDEKTFFFMCYSYCQGIINFINIFLTVVLCQICQKMVSIHITPLQFFVSRIRNILMKYLNNFEYWS